jgi:hypothetical protein
MVLRNFLVLFIKLVTTSIYSWKYDYFKWKSAIEVYLFNSGYLINIS